jgi:hypothetical protein
MVQNCTLGVGVDFSPALAEEFTAWARARVAKQEADWRSSSGQSNKICAMTEEYRWGGDDRQFCRR